MDLITSRNRMTRLKAGLCISAGAALLVANCAVLGTGPVAADATSAPARSASGLLAGKWGDPAADAAATDAYGKNSAQKDAGSLYTVEKAIGARALWAKKDSLNRNLTGQGVGVAVLDSGVAKVAGLSATGKLIYGPDLSIESNGGLSNQDTYGHGTFMAGIIAGRGASNPSSDLPSAPANVQLGVAPDAKLLAMKLAATDGSTDVSQVIAALDWVTEHPTMPDGTRIRVINLSYGTDSAQSYLTDPLAAAAENAWRHGIVVVASVGNSGTATGRVTDPASDPYVLAVGASSASNLVNGWTPGKVKPASFSNVAPTGRHADLLAPGTSLVSLRDPSSYIDTNNPQGRVSGDTTGTLFRGSGTSQAAAVASGAIALLLQAYPSLTPDQVKAVLTAGADPIAGASATVAGAGELNLTKAMDLAGKLTASTSAAALARGLAVQAYPAATGLGSLDLARGGSVMVDADGTDLSGEVDAQGNTWHPAVWSSASRSLTAWSGGAWLGSVWTGDHWDTSGGLSSARWSTARWSTARWSVADWTTARWSAARWSSARWSCARWSANAW